MLSKFSAIKNIKDAGRNVLAKASSTAKQAAANAKQQPEDQFIVALDIGTEYVKALVGRIVAGEDRIEIVGVGRQHQNLSDMQAGAIADIASVVDNCDKALSQAEQQSGVS